MTRYLLPLLLLSACESSNITGTDGIPEFFWDGENVEELLVESSDIVTVWQITPEEPPEGVCENALDGSEGVVYNQLPPGYRTIARGEPLVDGQSPPMENVPESLPDGEYVLALQRCVSTSNGIRGFENIPYRFEIVDGDVSILEE